jgi:hypothetical protein
LARNSRHRDYARLPLLAGWLFADLFVVLFIIGLASGSIPLGSHKKPTPPHSASPTATPTPASTPTHARSAPTPRPLMQRTPDDIDITPAPAELQQLEVSPGNDGQLLNALLSKVRGKGRVGFILVFFPGPDPGPATQAAQAFFAALPAEKPAIFGGASGEGLWDGDVDYVEFQVFYL